MYPSKKPPWKCPRCGAVLVTRGMNYYRHLDRLCKPRSRKPRETGGQA